MTIFNPNKLSLDKKTKLLDAQEKLEATNKKAARTAKKSKSKPNSDQS